MKTTKQVIIRMESGIAGYDFYTARKVNSNGKVSYEFLSKILNKSPEVEFTQKYMEFGSSDTNQDLGYEFEVTYTLEKNHGPFEGEYCEKAITEEERIQKGLKADAIGNELWAEDWLGYRLIESFEELEYGVETVEFEKKIAVALNYSELSLMAWNEIGKEAATIKQTIDLNDLAEILQKKVNEFQENKIIETMSFGNYKARKGESGFDLYLNDNYVLTLEECTCVWDDARRIKFALTDINPTNGKVHFLVMKMWARANMNPHSEDCHIYGISKTVEEVLFEDLNK